MERPGDSVSREIVLRCAGATLKGDLVIPGDAVGMVVFAHGTGSSRHSPRNHRVAEQLRRVGLGTLLFDLLTEEEERRDIRTRELRFNVRLLADRLTGALQWLEQDPTTAELPTGAFGASTGAAAALSAAALWPERVRAVVSRGGRPDLAGEALDSVRAPTLLIVGSADRVVVDLNRQAQQRMRCPVRLELVPGATHLFEEPGALERVAGLAADWLLRHLGSG
jgi:pimeloyl-ACP methyl ester carboxylesterase